MNTYLIPREIVNENRFLIFSPKSLVFTLIGIVVGTVVMIPFLLISELANFLSWLKWIGIIFNAIIIILFWAMGTFKIPESNSFALLKNAGGESVDIIVKRVVNFKKKRKIYVYKGGNK